jgi:pimeloyl-ACP methyl ester carboxylesterase
MLSKPFRHEDAAADIFALLDHLGINSCTGLGISGGGNVLLHMATKRPGRVKAMVLVSATPHFPAQARPIMREYPNGLPETPWEILRRCHPCGDPQINAILASLAPACAVVKFKRRRTLALHHLAAGKNALETTNSMPLPLRRHVPPADLFRSAQST